MIQVAYACGCNRAAAMPRRHLHFLGAPWTGDHVEDTCSPTMNASPRPIGRMQCDRHLLAECRKSCRGMACNAGLLGTRTCFVLRHLSAGCGSGGCGGDGSGDGANGATPRVSASRPCSFRRPRHPTRLERFLPPLQDPRRHDHHRQVRRTAAPANSECEERKSPIRASD